MGEGGSTTADLDTETASRWRPADNNRRASTLANFTMTRTTLDHTPIGRCCPRYARSRRDRPDDGEVDSAG